jgi:hypothetical protein
MSEYSPGSNSIDGGWSSEGSGDPNAITSRKLDWGMASIRLVTIKHSRLLQWATIITVAVAAAVTENDIHEKEFIIHISLTTRR